MDIEQHLAIPVAPTAAFQSPFDEHQQRDQSLNEAPPVVVGQKTHKISISLKGQRSSPAAKIEQPIYAFTTQTGSPESKQPSPFSVPSYDKIEAEPRKSTRPRTKRKRGSDSEYDEAIEAPTPRKGTSRRKKEPAVQSTAVAPKKSRWLGGGDSDDEAESRRKVQEIDEEERIEMQREAALNNGDTTEVPDTTNIAVIDPTMYLFPFKGEDANNYIDVESNYFLHDSTISYLHEDETKIFKEKPPRETWASRRTAILQSGGRVGIIGPVSAEFDPRLWRKIVYRDFTQALQNRSNGLVNAKKMALMCQKEVRRRAQKTIKTPREIANKAKKSVREMLIHWRKSDREERENRKKAEKEAVEKRKKDEEEREAKRHQRKLNFLLTQTELFSHFVSKKPGEEGEVQTEVGAPSSVGPTSIVDQEDDDVVREEARKASQAAFQSHMRKNQEFDESISKLKASAPPEAPSKKKTSAMADVEDDVDAVKQPSILKGNLKAYQLKGLSWLVNLYDQGVNGILADEMGLGKTIQSISFLAHLAEEKDIWGPFLIVTPSSTLHNWQKEITKFCPSLKALPYWGTQKERAVIRKFWNPKTLYSRSAPFHVLITSYSLAVLDEKYFNRLKWQYMILDEAQALKSSNSSRWKTLLRFNCRNRLLLTGTPIQNSMTELWALLHFIMPTLFESHDDFNEWFSKDIESHAIAHKALNEHQLNRLHLILKPFMLRRIKKDVEQEIGEKIELEVPCDLSTRQKKLYAGIKDKISISELFENSLTEKGVGSLMNLVMQFRKVCNHPEIFERSDSSSPFQFQEPMPEPQILPNHIPFVCSVDHNPIQITLPRILYKEVLDNSESQGFSSRLLYNAFCIFTVDYVYRSSTGNYERDSQRSSGCFGFTRMSDLSPSDLNRIAFSNDLEKIQFIYNLHDRIVSKFYHESEHNGDVLPSMKLLITPKVISGISGSSPSMTELITRRFDNPSLLRRIRDIDPPVIASSPRIYCSNSRFMSQRKLLQHSATFKSQLLGIDCSPWSPSYAGAPSGLIPGVPGLLEPLISLFGTSHIKIADFSKLVSDSGKLQVLDALLTKLKTEGHRVLVYSQMTKMLDILEDFMWYRGHKFVRLDGSTKLADRRDMVDDFQSQPEIFVFLLSTKAGGLGINLTAADTVIFYDSDWNPTNDQQAMDRAHRLGQTKQVTVYRIVTKGTVEDRILKRAKQKNKIQSIVIAGGNFKSEDAPMQAREVVSLLLDDAEMEAGMKLQEEGPRKRRGAPRKNPVTVPSKKMKKDVSGSTTSVPSTKKAEVPKAPKVPKKKASNPNKKVKDNK